MKFKARVAWDSSRLTASAETQIPTREEVRSIPLLPVAATGGSLVIRIRRLLYPQTRTIALTPFFSAAMLAATAAVALAAWEATPPRPGPQQPGQEESRYLRWLNEDVTYIINDAERAAFLRLNTDEECDMFIRQFWLRRDPTPGTARNEFKEEHCRRIAYANEHFAAGNAGWRTDRGRIYILYGPPDDIENGLSGGGLPITRWLYHHIDGIGDQIIVTFADSTGKGDYKMAPGPNPH